MVEESLLVKCNMLESTDPELAVMIKDLRDKEMKVREAKPSKPIPKLNLKDMQIHTEYS